MKIAITATGPSLEAEAEPRFGRCPYFIIADPETLEFSAEENSSATTAHGAGIAAAQAIADKGVQAVLTGHCGPNAFQVLSAAGISIHNSAAATVAEALEQYLAVKLTAASAANVEGHWS